MSSNIKQIIYKNFNIVIREGTSDQFVAKEVLSGEYRKLSLNESDVVLDLGSNIGMFSLFAHSKVKQIIGYEPELENYTMALKNLSLNGVNNVILNNAAVVGNNDTTRNFSINTKKNKGAHSLVPKRGRDTITVNCENINTIIQRHNPTVIKMDIEGGEYECLPVVSKWSNINQIILEYHHAHLNDSDKSKFNEILNLLKNNFSSVEYRNDPKGAWVSIIYAKK